MPVEGDPLGTRKARRDSTSPRKISASEPGPRRAAVKGKDQGRFPVVGIGASAGGLDAYLHLFDRLPPATGMGYVVIQHMDPSKESLLVDILARSVRNPIVEAKNRMKVAPDRIHVIPPNTNMGIENGRLTLLPRPDRREPAPAHRFLLPLACAGPGGQGDRRRPFGDRKRRHPGGADDQGRGRDHLRPGRAEREISRDASERRRKRLRRFRPSARRDRCRAVEVRRTSLRRKESRNPGPRPYVGGRGGYRADLPAHPGSDRGGLRPVQDRPPRCAGSCGAWRSTRSTT